MRINTKRQVCKLINAHCYVSKVVETENWGTDREQVSRGQIKKKRRRRDIWNRMLSICRVIGNAVVLRGLLGSSWRVILVNWDWGCSMMTGCWLRSRISCAKWTSDWDAALVPRWQWEKRQESFGTYTLWGRAWVLEPQTNVDGLWSRAYCLNHRWKEWRILCGVEELELLLEPHTRVEYWAWIRGLTLNHVIDRLRKWLDVD